MRLGTAFQLVDDVLDLSGDSQEIGKNLGDDLAEGKPTLPLIYAMRKGKEQQRDLIRHAIEVGDIKELPAVLEAVRDTGALDYVRNLARKEAEFACSAIAHLADSTYHQTLIKLAEFAVNRNF